MAPRRLAGVARKPVFAYLVISCNAKLETSTCVVERLSNIMHVTHAHGLVHEPGHLFDLFAGVGVGTFLHFDFNDASSKFALRHHVAFLVTSESAIEGLVKAMFLLARRTRRAHNAMSD